VNNCTYLYLRHGNTKRDRQGAGNPGRCESMNGGCRGLSTCLCWRSRDTEICAPGATLTPENNPYTGLPGLSAYPPLPSSLSYSIFSNPSYPPTPRNPVPLHPVSLLHNLHPPCGNANGSPSVRHCSHHLPTVLCTWGSSCFAREGQRGVVG
jgi:hypothetical protein